MVKPTESSYRNQFSENFSSFEKNSRGGQKAGADEEYRFSTTTSVYEPQSPEDLRQMKGSMSVSQASVVSRKNNQWNVQRDIPVGTVRNNPFLPEPKQQPPQSPQLKYQKKQWDTSNIPKGSVAARIQKSNSPSNNTNGGNHPVSPSKVMGRSNSRSKTFSTSSPVYSQPKSNEAIRSTTSTPRGFFPKSGTSSPQIKQKPFVKHQEQIVTDQQASQRFDEVKEKIATTRGWEPSKEIPNGTVKGRLSSLYGGQKTLKGNKLEEIPTSAPKNSKKTELKSFNEVSTTNEEKLNDDDDHWIISERKGADIQVFGSDWGEAIPARSAESEDWDTPGKEWIPSGESQTDVVSCDKIQEKAVEDKPCLPAEIAAPGTISKLERNKHTKARVESKPSMILAPPPKDASAYHNKTLSQKSEEVSAFDTKSDSSFSQLFNENFGSFAVKSDMESVENSKLKSSFPVHDDIDQQLVNGASDAFGFPVSSVTGATENRLIGEVVSGDEFFDASVLPDDSGQSSNDKSSYGTSAVLGGYAESRGDPGFDNYAQQTNGVCFATSPVSSKDIQPTSDEEPFDAPKMATYFDRKQTRDQQDRHVSVTHNSYGQPSRNSLASDLDQYQSTGSAASTDDGAQGSTHEFEEIGKGDSKKKKKGFLKGLFGRKSKGNGKIKQSSKENKNRRSYSKADLSESVPNSSEASYLGHSSTFVNQNVKKQNSVNSKEINQNLPREENVPKGKNTIISNSFSHEKVDNGFSAQSNVFGESSTLGDVNQSKAVSMVKPSLSGDDVFDDLEDDSNVLPTPNAEAGDEFLDPELDHLDSNIDSDEESRENVIGPSKVDTDFDPIDTTKTLKMPSPDLETRRVSMDSNEGQSPARTAITNKATTEPSSRPRFQYAHETHQSVDRKRGSMLRPTSSVPRHHSLTSSESNLLPMRLKKSSLYNREDQRRGGKQRKDGAFSRHRLPSRNAIDSQYGRENMETKKFSRAAHAYNSITKKNRIEDVEDQRKYLSIPAASTSASDISCASTYDTYQKKLAESLRKANIGKMHPSDYSFHSKRSLDDSSIESDIRVLRSILRRPRLDRDNARVINASRQIQGFPTYDTESATDPMQRLGMRLLSSAIIPIQTEVRRFLAMRQALTRMWALIVIQAHARRFLARKRFRKAKDSVVTIQSVLRGHLARNEVIDKHICAIEIQRFVRGYLATMQVYEDIYKVTLVQSLVRMRIAMDYAAYRMSLVIQLQAIARGFLTRRRNARLHSCATVIQSSWRCFYSRLNYQFDLLDIIIVQSLWRKKLGMRIAQRKVAEKRNNAATLIQAGWRAYDCRMDFLCYTAARTIQSAGRMFICRLQYIDYQAAVAIQSIARMHLCRTDYTYYKCAKKIQSIARMSLCRSDYLEYKAATKVQSIVRMFLCRSGFVEYRCATKIQSIGRMYLCRYDYLEYKAATTLQSAVRMFLCRSDYNKYRAEIAATMIQAKWRSYDCSSMYKRYRAARTIQKTWRSYDCHMNFLHFLADILIVQSTIRRFLAQRKVKAMKNDAAVKIQSAWRGLICYIDYHEHLTVRRIQSAWRGYMCRRNVKREKAAIVIQSAWRGFLFYADYMFELSDIVVAQKQVRVWLAKRVANRRRQEVVTKQRQLAATMIQSSWRRFWCFSNFVIALDCSIQIQAQVRGYLQRKDFMSRKHAVSVIESAWLNAQAKKLTSQMSVIREITNSSREIAAMQSSAAIKLQQVFRGSLCRNALKVYLAAVLIQSHVRGKQARVAVGLYTAARKIQAAWRGFIPRQSYTTYIAVRKIQATWRSYLPRQKFISFKRETNAAISIQSAWRGFVSYTDFVFTISDIVAAQKIARGYLARKKYSGVIRSNLDEKEARSNAATTIQMIFRGFQARQNYWYTLGCTMQIQSWWRGRRVYRKIQKEARAVLTLQCFARCCLARQEYMQRRFVFMLIQTAELERSKKAKGSRTTKQKRTDTEELHRNDAARVIQRFFSDVDHQRANELVVATKRRKEWREKMKKENYSDDTEEILLEDVWTGLIGKNDFVDEPFTRHYDDFSKLKGPAIMVAPHPTSSIRMLRKVDAVDMDDDFQLEEAFIDAEICHAKERRQDRRTLIRIGKEKRRSQSICRDGIKSKANDAELVGSKGKRNVLATSNH